MGAVRLARKTQNRTGKCQTGCTMDSIRRFSRAQTSKLQTRKVILKDRFRSLGRCSCWDPPAQVGFELKLYAPAQNAPAPRRVFARVPCVRTCLTSLSSKLKPQVITKKCRNGSAMAFTRRSSNTALMQASFRGIIGCPTERTCSPMSMETEKAMESCRTQVKARNGVAISIVFLPPARC